MSFLGKHFNSTTFNGRANVAKATYASFALMYVIYRVRKATKDDEPLEELEIENENNGCGCGCGCDSCQKNSQPESKESKLSIPEDPLLKARKKQCDCDKNNGNGKTNTPVDDEDGCID